MVFFGSEEPAKPIVLYCFHFLATSKNQRQARQARCMSPNWFCRQGLELLLPLPPFANWSKLIQEIHSLMIPRRTRNPQNFFFVQIKKHLNQTISSLLSIYIYIYIFVKKTKNFAAVAALAGRLVRLCEVALGHFLRFVHPMARAKRSDFRNSQDF